MDFSKVGRGEQGVKIVPNEEGASKIITPGPGNLGGAGPTKLTNG